VDAFIQQRLCLAMEEQGFDGLVAYSPENIAYGIGYTIPSQSLGVRDRQFALAVNRDGRAILLLTANEREEAEARSAVRELRPYHEFDEDPMQVLAAALVELGLENGRVGVEKDAIPADRWEDLNGHLTTARLEPAGHAFARARMVKGPAELDRLREASRIADLAQLEAHDEIRAGMTEQDLYRIITDRALAHGADTVKLIQVAAGERSVLSNPTPSDRPLRRGEVVKIDVFVTVGGYLSDTGRAIVVGEATDEQRDIWQRMQETLAFVHEILRPGVRADEVWNQFVGAFEQRGLEPAMGFLGHGLGLSLHEEPYIAPHSKTVLEDGMVLAVEPVYRRGTSGFHLEDNLIVTATGVENMTSRIATDLIVAGSQQASVRPQLGAA
jgi:Xaa-Pro dipeptidase